jgi:2-dehydro-3-deoxyphosphogluconate aldolase/(4S)-4-hydroxy-2-oxoglutarate aldolase
MGKGAKSEVIEQLLDERVVAVVRLARERDGLPVAKALVDGGVRAIEITITTPGAVRLIETVAREIPEAIVGAGSVLSCEDVDRCLEAGARFLVGPVLNEPVLTYALDQGLPFSPGTFTPSEAYRAWELGSRLVKVFPAARLGPKYVSDLKAPMPFLRLMPTGGVSSESAAAFLDAGADVLGAGSWLTPRAAIDAGEYDVIRERATELRRAADGSGK